MTSEELNWQRAIQNARSHPGMMIGEQKNAHLLAISSAFRLIGELRAFCYPAQRSVHLSPSQYVVTCQAGPMEPSLESLLTFENKYVLTSGWSEVNKAFFKMSRNSQSTYQPPDGWEYHLSGPTSPYLDGPVLPAYLALRFAFAYKSSHGIWCQSFVDGSPLFEPQLIKTPHKVGLMSMGELSSQWFTGLPFTEENVAKLNGLSQTSAYWHPHDDILPIGSIRLEVIQQWLDR